ncbi:MAG TPA: peroxiredoxin [Thermomicrobiales bacterium]|nr:peroxiredoxin [Thermomicrobiales bacterium]
MALLEVGVEAPEIVAKTGSGEDFRLSDLRGVLRVMLIFYPKDFTPGCTDQLIQVRKNIDHIRRAGIEPVGVNPDDADTHERFREAHALNFELLVDEDMQAAKAYGAVKPEGGIQRSVFVIGKDGKVMFAREGAPAWQIVLNAIRQVDDGEPIDA